MSEIDDVKAVRTEYEQVRPKFEKIAIEIHDILQTKLGEAKLTPVSITYRAKTIDSFVEKISRKNYTKPLSDMTDLAGVRVVCTYGCELEQIAEIINANFDVCEHKDKRQDLGADRMGYNGKAFVVKLGTRYAGGRYEGITDFICEIQVRTVLQDAWAIINHQLVYKNEELIPERLRRDLNNVASLLEIAQGIFDSVKEKRTHYIGEIEQKKENALTFLAQSLDFDTLLVYTRWKFPDLEPSEKLTRILLKDINLKKYPTLQELDKIVDRARPAVEKYQKEKSEWFKSGTDFLTKSLGFVDPEFRANHGFASKTREAFDKYKSLIAQ